MRSPGTRSRRLVLCAAPLLLALTAGCGGGDGSEPSDASLRDRLLPAAQVPGFKFHRAFIWTNAIDVTGEGLHISENTRPSEIVKALEKADFVKGAGQELQQGGPQGPVVAIGVLKFKSDSGAKDTQELLHREYRKQPCYGVCSQATHDMEVKDIPGATGQESVADPAAPPEAPPGFEAYAVEFTVGPYLYVVGAGFGFGSKENALNAARKLYERVKDRDT